MLVLLMGIDAKAVNKKVVATKEGTKEQKRPLFDIDGCGRNRTCREHSRECKKMQMASLLGDKITDEDSEVVTTKDKMEELAKVMKESRKNFTACMVELGIEMPTKEAKPMKIKIGRLLGKRRGSDKKHKENFGLDTDKATQVRKCLLSKTQMLNADDTLNREALATKMLSGYASQPDVQAAVEDAIDTCPEPQDFKMHDFLKCVNKACIDNIVIEDEE